VIRFSCKVHLFFLLIWNAWTNFQSSELKVKEIRPGGAALILGDRGTDMKPVGIFATTRACLKERLVKHPRGWSLCKSVRNQSYKCVTVCGSLYVC
jgi:hypothetical protein